TASAAQGVQSGQTQAGAGVEATGEPRRIDRANQRAGERRARPEQDRRDERRGDAGAERHRPLRGRAPRPLGQYLRAGALRCAGAAFAAPRPAPGGSGPLPAVAYSRMPETMLSTLEAW